MSRRRDRITDEAASWFVQARDSGFSSDDRKELASWLAASAEHVEEYLSLAAVSGEIRDAARGYDVDELVAIARDASYGADVVALPWPEAAPRDVESAVNDENDNGRTRRRGRPFIWATAATMLAAAALSTFFFSTPDHNLYVTGVGEQASFPLEDGSIVSLNAQSMLRVEFSDEGRNVRLVSGEAMFDVAREPNRPFRVVTDGAMIQAVGTQFNVRYRGADTMVTVVEGVVDVQSTPPPPPSGGAIAQLPAPDAARPADSHTARLTVGQQARVASGEVAVIDTNVQEATSWRERRLVFDARPLEDVVSEFNLYNDDQFVISDAVLGDRVISGVFGADDRESFVLFLSAAGLADYEMQADGTIVLQTLEDTD